MSSLQSTFMSVFSDLPRNPKEAEEQLTERLFYRLQSAGHRAGLESMSLGSGNPSFHKSSSGGDSVLVFFKYALVSLFALAPLLKLLAFFFPDIFCQFFIDHVFDIRNSHCFVG